MDRVVFVNVVVFVVVPFSLVVSEGVLVDGALQFLVVAVQMELDDLALEVHVAVPDVAVPAILGELTLLTSTFKLGVTSMTFSLRFRLTLR